MLGAGGWQLLQPARVRPAAGAMLGLLLLACGCCLLGSAHAAPPNISTATLPVAYYGSSYITKSPAVYNMLSRQRVVVLMQQDGDEPAGHCWLECCPEVQ